MADGDSTSGPGPIKADAPEIMSVQPARGRSALPDLPASFDPRSHAKVDYYGQRRLPEYLCYCVEILARKLLELDPERDLDHLRIFLSRLHGLTLGKDRKASLLALKIIGDLSGLTVLWDRRAAQSAVNVTVNLSDVIIQARERLRLVDRTKGVQDAG